MKHSVLMLFKDTLMMFLFPVDPYAYKYSFLLYETLTED